MEVRKNGHILQAEVDATDKGVGFFYYQDCPKQKGCPDRYLLGLADKDVIVTSHDLPRLKRGDRFTVDGQPALTIHEVQNNTATEPSLSERAAKLANKAKTALASALLRPFTSLIQWR